MLRTKVLSINNESSAQLTVQSNTIMAQNVHN